MGHSGVHDGCLRRTVGATDDPQRQPARAVALPRRCPCAALADLRPLWLAPLEADMGRWSLDAVFRGEEECGGGRPELTRDGGRSGGRWPALHLSCIVDALPR